MAEEPKEPTESLPNPKSSEHSRRRRAKRRQAAAQKGRKPEPSPVDQFVEIGKEGNTTPITAEEFSRLLKALGLDPHHFTLSQLASVNRSDTDGPKPPSPENASGRINAAPGAQAHRRRNFRNRYSILESAQAPQAGGSRQGGQAKARRSFRQRYSINEHVAPAQQRARPEGDLAKMRQRFKQRYSINEPYQERPSTAKSLALKTANLITKVILPMGASYQLNQGASLLVHFGLAKIMTIPALATFTAAAPIATTVVAGAAACALAGGVTNLLVTSIWGDKSSKHWALKAFGKGAGLSFVGGLTGGTLGHLLGKASGTALRMLCGGIIGAGTRYTTTMIDKNQRNQKGAVKKALLAGSIFGGLAALASVLVHPTEAAAATAPDSQQNSHQHTPVRHEIQAHAPPTDSTTNHGSTHDSAHNGSANHGHEQQGHHPNKHTEAATTHKHHHRHATAAHVHHDSAALKEFQKEFPYGYQDSNGTLHPGSPDTDIYLGKDNLLHSRSHNAGQLQALMPDKVITVDNDGIFHAKDPIAAGHSPQTGNPVGHEATDTGGHGHGPVPEESHAPKPKTPMQNVGRFFCALKRLGPRV